MRVFFLWEVCGGGGGGGGVVRFVKEQLLDLLPRFVRDAVRVGGAPLDCVDIEMLDGGVPPGKVEKGRGTSVGELIERHDQGPESLEVHQRSQQHLAHVIVDVGTADLYVFEHTRW